MNGRQHAEAAERRLEAVSASRHRLAELADLGNDKTPAMWAEVSELKLNLQLAYDGANVHAGLAVFEAVSDLTAVLERGINERRRQWQQAPAGGEVV
jgi:hypothetical protein